VDNETVEMGIRFPAEAQAAVAARRFVHGLEPFVEERVLEDVELLVSELVANSFRHGGLGPRDVIELQVTAGPDRVRVDVIDHGVGFSQRSPTLTRGHAPGWGLRFVDVMANRWGVYLDGATRVWFEIDRF
jgi:anti-sigma regulatory factor (Ser/Thr protein kinase)